MTIATQPFGRSGHRSTRTIFGAASLSHVAQQEADRTLEIWMGRQHTRDTWYEPLEDQQDIDLAVHWVLKRPGIFLNTVGDIHLLPKVLDAASRFQEGSPGPTNEQMQALVARSGMEPLFV